MPIIVSPSATTLATPKTWADMLQTLRVRCGLHATVGSAPALSDILTEANEYVHGQLDDGLPLRSTIALLADSAQYEFLDDVGDPVSRGSVQSIWIEQGDSNRVPLSQGITHTMRADQDQRAIPEYWDTFYQADGTTFMLEVWPTPDQAYTAYVDYNHVLGRFSESTDLPSAPYRLVFGYALAMGKAHYGKPDAETVGAAFKSMLYKEKVRNKENRRFLPRTDRQPVARVVSTAGGFRQVWG